jgi:hypothetical protein
LPLADRHVEPGDFPDPQVRRLLAAVRTTFLTVSPCAYPPISTPIWVPNFPLDGGFGRYRNSIGTNIEMVHKKVVKKA